MIRIGASSLRANGTLYLQIQICTNLRISITRPPIPHKGFEETLLKRIEEYRRNYFLWVEDFTLPTTNNLSERGLRGIKSHMKISGQFESEKAAQNFARIKTYIETCRRNNINEIHALQRLCEGTPYTVEEIFIHKSA